MFTGLLKNYRKKLINLSGSNRALLLLRLSKENDLDLNEADFLLNKPSFQIIENLISGKTKFPICTLLDSRNEQANRIGKSLLKIARKDHFLFEESGSCDLYVGWPFVRGKFSDGTFTRCPLLFFPVQLRLEENVWQLVQRQEVPISLNKSFLLAWQHYNSITLTEDFVETSFESFSKDSREFRSQLYELLKTNGLEIHFNSELFVDKLDSFREYKAADFAQETEDGRVKLYNEAVLGIFPQAGSYLVPDYDALLVQSSEFVVPSLEEFFSSNKEQQTTNYELNIELIKERDIQTPLALDAPQEQALKQVKAGNSIVVQGPPGTGKSQLICNLVSDFISRGKRVLVVCQKRAALDVVYKRLESIGAADFVALVHDFKADRNAIYSKIASQIEKVDAYKRANNGLDTVFLERNYLEACKKIDQIVAQLESFKTALFDTSECGVSVKELYLSVQRKDVQSSTFKVQSLDSSNFEHGTLNFELKYFTHEKLKAFNSKLKYLLPSALQYDSENHPWQLRKNFKNHSSADRQKLAESLGEMHRFSESLVKTLDKLIVNIPQLWELRIHQTLLEELLDFELKNNSSLFYLHFQKFATVSQAETKQQKWQNKLTKWKTQVLERCDKPLAREVSSENISLIFSKVEKAKRLLASFFGSIHWKLFSKERAEIQALLKSNLLPETLEGVASLSEKITNSQQFFLLRDELKQSKDFNFGEEESAENYLEAIETIEKALAFAHRWSIAHKEISFPIPLQKLSVEVFFETTSEVKNSIQKVEQTYLSHFGYFAEDHLHELFTKETFYQSLQLLDSEFDAMVEYDRAKEELEFQELQALEGLVRSSEFVVRSSQFTSRENKEQRTTNNELNTTNDELVKNFNAQIRNAWIDHIEAKYPILKSVSTPTMAMLEVELNEAIAEKQKLSREILILKLREQVYRHEEFNRLGNRTTFRDLQHQTTKKKKIWPLRKTIESFHDEAFQVLPCWLASPETVSAVFPMEKLFDLVIFDEASQCFSEKGIPAMARGKQLVIAGDSKQLQPNDLYRTRFNEDDEEIPETEIDSLLELGTRYLPQVMLTEHYRSRSLDLIHFSNQHFYKNKLQLLPDFQTYQSKTKGIEFVKSAGFLENHCNQLEAEMVVDICMNLFSTNSEKEVGVITFNIYQQNLILDLLEQKCVEEKRIIPESFFVKNIENIQGDEKDIIIFSIGYAPDRAGRMNHHFGSLNMDGGENRLNVAVTRAREKVIVVSSIYPQQLNVENTKHEGPKLLKKYLEYALEVSEGRFVSTTEQEIAFRSEWYLKDKLKEQNPLLVEELPFADLVEKDAQNQFSQLILTDDDKFFNSLSVKETFSYLPTTLKAKNWKFERKWSRGFFRKS